MLPKVKIVTDLGKIIIELYSINALITSLNFLKYVEHSSYKKELFFRAVRTDNHPNNAIKTEVIQGDIYAEERLNPAYALKSLFGVKLLKS